MTRPGTSNSSAVADTWVGGMSLTALTEALRLNQVGSTQQSVDTQRFWSTPAREATDGTTEVMQVTFATARRFNQLELDLAVFPHDAHIEFYDEQTGAWSPCLDEAIERPQPINYGIRDAIPAVLPPASTVLGHLHPQHSFTGHWRTVTFSIKPVFAKNLRILLSRTTQGTTPTSAQGVKVPYSLAVRNLNITYEIRKLADVPWTAPGTGESRETFASTSDLFGSPVDFAVRVNSATNAIGATQGVNGLTTVWKSEPQPIPWAVVNFYVDGRDPGGEGQILDRFYLDPLYDGPSVNLYWSNSEPTGAFRANSDPLPPAIAQVNNSGGVTGDVLNFDDPTLADAIAFVELDNRGITFDPSRPWWLGGQLNFKFRHGTQNENHPIFDCGAFRLVWTPLGPRLTTEAGDTLLLTTQTPAMGIWDSYLDGSGNVVQEGSSTPTFIGFDPATALGFVVWSDGAQLGLTIRYGTTEFSGSLTLSAPFTSDVLKMRVGGLLGADPGTPKFRLSALVLKTDDVPDEEAIDTFLDDPLPYALGSQYLGVNDARTDNALVRYHHSFYTPDFPAAMIGGAPDRYDAMEWTPVTRDFVLRRGYMYFPPTRAKYWKFEFTNLSPQPYEVYRPVQKQVNVFPSEQWRKALTSTPTRTAAGLNELAPGLENVYVVNTLTQSLDGNRTAVLGTGAAKSNTTARIIYDSDVRSRVGEAYWAWSFLPMHHTGVTPSWESAGRHNYQVIDYTQTTKIGYLVGLRSIQAYRLNYLSSDDTAQYVEEFYDDSSLDSGSSWRLVEDHVLSSGDTTYAEVRGKALTSNRVVSAIQFASQQSEPVQLLPDPELAAEDLPNWDAVGDAVISNSSGLIPTLESTRRIDRSLPPLTWGRVMAGYPTYADFVVQGATYGLIASGSQIPAEAGGIASKAVSVPPGGRVHVAARVTAPADLTRPLAVQLIDADTETVLSESLVDVKGGKIVEWFANYTVGEGTSAEPWLYRDFTTGYTSANLSDTFARANATTLGSMDSGQVWSWRSDSFGVEQSLDIASNAATNTALGQYDFIDTGSPWGTLEVTIGTMGTGSATTALLRLDPMFITEVGGLAVLSGSTVLSTRGLVLGAGNTSYTVQSGDKIRIDFLPVDYVPSDKLDATATTVADQYAMMFWVNGVWKSTRYIAHGAMPTKGIKGKLGQKFTKVTWTPADYGMLPGPVISGMPRKTNGTWVDVDTMQTWQTISGRIWHVASSNTTNTLTASWDVSNDQETAADDVGATLVAGSDDAVFWTDTGAWSGSMIFRVRNVAGTAGQTQPAGRRGLIACLDFDTGVYLDALGNIVQNGTTLQTGFLPSGITTTAPITLTFYDARHSNPLASTGRTLVAIVGQAIVGTANSTVMAQLTGTKRGLAGARFSGTRPGGASYTIDTAFQSFNWAPSAKLIAQPAALPTWGEVTKNGTLTYGEIVANKLVTSPRVKARVVQKGPSEDVWDVDNISLFADPIVWSFSNDNGFNFYPAYEIRNNPAGVLVFPDHVEGVSLSQRPGTALVWRAVSYLPGSIISSLVIRPWYGGLTSGIDHRAGLVATSPNVMPFDHFGPIKKDSRFQTWSSPVPRSWWYAFRILQRVPAANPEAVQAVLAGYPGENVFPSSNVYPGVPS
jgi:hypothetical protein